MQDLLAIGLLRIGWTTQEPLERIVGVRHPPEVPLGLVEVAGLDRLAPLPELMPNPKLGCGRP